MRLIVQKGIEGFSGAYRMISRQGPAIATKVKTFFSSDPAKKQAVVSALKAWPNRMPNAAQVAQYVKANPLNSLVLLITAAETADFAYDLIAEDPVLEQAFNTLVPVDDVKSVALPDAEYKQKQTAAIEAMATTREELRNLPVSALLRFKDEVAVIKELEAMLPGETATSRRELLNLLVRVCQFESDVFLARELLDELGE